MESIDTGTEFLRATVHRRVATLTLNRPDKRNALGSDLTPALRDVLLRVEADPRVRVVVITGAGKAFCSGGDVSGMGGPAPGASGGTGPGPSVQDRIRALQHAQESLTLRLYELSKPTIAALPGAAAGAGCSIALAADLRIAAESAFITTAFANIGLSGDFGASWLLTQLVGVARAKELFYTSRRVGAAECLALGIFNEVVPDDELADRTQVLAERIAAGPPVALRYMKENLNRAVQGDFAACLKLEADRMVRSGATQDHKQPVAAFLEKRTPVFTGA
jgi:2-(1,2-epoxy-1,2-dihydrophenyl)acetyl-CoA isomerase